MLLKKLLLILLFLPLLGSSCQFGSVQFESNVKDFTFNPDGTVFAYPQDQDNSANVTILKPFHIRMTWISIDPSRDLNDFDSIQKREIISAFKKHDFLSITFSDEKSINTHTTYNKTNIIAKMGLDARTKDVEKEQLLDVIEIKITQYAPTASIQGTIQFSFGTTLMKGTFTAPILQGDAAKMAQKNWEELTE